MTYGQKMAALCCSAPKLPKLQPLLTLVSPAGSPRPSDGWKAQTDRQTDRAAAVIRLVTNEKSPCSSW